MRKRVEGILFWGSLWGLEEATLGYLLHMLPVSIGWVFYFPLAYAFMNAAYRKTGKASSVLYTAFLAAAIKLLDLLITVQIQKVVNPAAAIILEGATVFALFAIAEKRPLLNRHAFVKVLSASVFQEVLFMLYIAVVPLISPSFRVVSGFWAYAEYIYHGIINAFLIYAFVKYSGFIAEKLKPSSEFIESLRGRKALRYLSKASPYLMLVISICVSLAV